MERQSKRAFAFCFVVFSLVLIVSSATDEKSQHDNGSITAVTKSNNNVSNAQRTGQQKGDEGNTKKPDAASQDAPKKNCTSGNKNDTFCKDDRSLISRVWENVSQNRDMLLRTMYVLLGVTAVVIVFFVIRSVGMRRKRNKSRKYGVITTRGDLEMEPLGQGEEEDEDYTVFEMNGRTK